MSMEEWPIFNRTQSRSLQLVPERPFRELLTLALPAE
jgi:hypothetical protein